MSQKSGVFSSLKKFNAAAGQKVAALNVIARRLKPGTKTKYGVVPKRALA